MRVWLAHEGEEEPSGIVSSVLASEMKAGLESLNTYSGFQQRAEAAKFGLLEFLLNARQRGSLILGYGAAAKGNTLLNYAGVISDLLPAVADRAKSKQGKFLPGSHIPVISPEQLDLEQPESLLVLPWNLILELESQLHCPVLVTAIPRSEEHTSELQSRQ